MRIALRSRKTKAGTVTLYLDCYAHGRRRLEYLGLYLTGDRASDKETMRLAETIRAQRQLDAAAGDHGLPAPSRQHGNFVEYCRKIGEGDALAPNTQLVWKNAIAHLVTFAGEVVPFQKVNEAFLSEFRGYLLKQVNANSASVYLARIKTGCRRATIENILPRYPGAAVTIRRQETRRVYLTLEELSGLERTPCGNAAVKQAFLFAAFSGLRYSDVKALTSDKVKTEGRETVLWFTQKKTGDVETLPLSDEAVAILKAQLEPKPSPNAAVFGLPAQQTLDKALKRWAQRAGIEKKISFHTARHSFATLGLRHGIDLFVMSKLLGHRDVSTTQIYAKVAGESKRAAVKLFPRLNGRKGTRHERQKVSTP